MKTFNKNTDYIFEIIHDLKAPVMSMDFALKGAQRDEFLDEIYKINRHNLYYIENLISAYSIEKGKYCPKYEIINLVKIVKEELAVLNFLIKEKILRVVISIDKLDDGYIVSDKSLVRQIVLNLLTNAVKYTPYAGSIKIVFEKKDGFLSICFSNPNNVSNENPCSSKMGLEIVKKKIKALKGKFKITQTIEEICFNVSFACLNKIRAGI